MVCTIFHFGAIQFSAQVRSTRNGGPGWILSYILSIVLPLPFHFHSLKIIALQIKTYFLSIISKLLILRVEKKLRVYIKVISNKLHSVTSDNCNKSYNLLLSNSKKKGNPSLVYTSYLRGIQIGSEYHGFQLLLKVYFH